MGIEFTTKRWDRIREDYSRWWAGELKRPLIHMALYGRDPGRPAPTLPFHHFTALYDLSVPAEAIVDVWDYHLSHFSFVGDGFPSMWPNFGPGVMAAFMGAGLEPKPDTVWFHPPDGVNQLGDVRLEYLPGNVWLDRVKEICRACIEHWQGLVQIGMTDLGGNLDVLHSFRPGGELLIDLCEDGDLAKELTWKAHEMWWKYFGEINDELRPANPGYTAWTPIYSAEPYYMLQCDACYMMGPDMFDEFVKPELAASCRRLRNAFYHLDGVGQLPHLDSLLEIEELKGVQWVPGAGKPGCSEWPQVYRKIRDAGKLVQLFGDMSTLDAVAQQVGGAEGIILITGADKSKETTVREFLDKYGAPVCT